MFQSQLRIFSIPLRSARAIMLAAVLFYPAWSAIFYSETKQTVVFIFTAAKDGSPLPLGTGFLTGVKAASGGYFLYLVTAGHVLHDSEGKALTNVFVRLNKS